MNTRKQSDHSAKKMLGTKRHGGGRPFGSKVIDGKVVIPGKDETRIAGNGSNGGNGHAVAAATVPARSSHLEVSSDAGKVKVQLDDNFVFVRRDYLDGLESRIAKIKELTAA